MSEDTPGQMGCVIDQVATDAALVSMSASAGRSVVFGDSRPSLRGNWEAMKARGVTAILMPQLAEKYFPTRKADYQARGTCVGRGTYRAVWLSYLAALDRKVMPGRPIVVAYEPIYAGARVEVGRGRLGSDDGAVGAYAAQFVSQFGVCDRNRFGAIDLSVDSPQGREDLAVAWGAPGKGVPAEVEAACAKHRFDAHFAKNVTEQMDAVSAFFPGAFCRNRLNGPRDANGMSRPAGSGAHCEAVVGVFITPAGDDALLMQQSWGNQPSGPSVLKIKNHPDYQLPQGCYGITASDQARVFTNGAESWHFEPREGSAWT